MSHRILWHGGPSIFWDILCQDYLQNEKTPNGEIIRKEKPRLALGLLGQKQMKEMQTFLKFLAFFWAVTTVENRFLSMVPGFLWVFVMEMLELCSTEQPLHERAFTDISFSLSLPLSLSLSLCLTGLVWAQEVRFEWGFCLVEKWPFCYKWVAYSDGRSTPLPEVPISILEWKILRASPTKALFIQLNSQWL